MRQSADVVVVGGGIVGLCAALAAAGRGMRITLVDDGRPGAASRASAGMLAPSLPGLPDSLHELAAAARDLYPDTVARLVAGSGVDIALDRSGILEVATSGSELDALHARAGAASKLDQRELAELEPALGAHAGALHHPLDGWVDNRALMNALWICAEKDPRIHVVRDRVASVDVSSGGAVAVLSNGLRLECISIVLATGAWSGVSGLPRSIPVRPVKGELLTLNRCPVRHVVYGIGGYVVPRGDLLLVGATSEEASFDPAPTAVGRTFLLGAASGLVPSLLGAPVVEHWAGLRPFSPDGLPILGADARHPALIYAGGFSRNGILLAPWAGNALGAALSGEISAGFPPEFSPGRFVENNNRL